MGGFNGVSFGGDDSTPYVMDQDRLLDQILGRMPDMDVNGSDPTPGRGAMAASSQPPSVQPDGSTQPPPGPVTSITGAPVDMGVYSRMPFKIPKAPMEPMGPPAPPPTGEIPAGPTPTPAAALPPPMTAGNPVRPVLRPDPGTVLPTPPVHNADEHARLQAALAQAQQPAQAKLTWKDRLKAAIVAAAAGYGRDPGAIGRGMEAGQKVLDRPQADADKQRADKIQSAKEAIDQHEYDYNQQREGYADSMTGYRDKTARMGEENREDNDAAKNKEKAGEIDPKAKPQKITENGKDKWVIKTRGGSYVDTDPPAEKTYKSAYERSQSSNPDEAKQGRKDYDTEQGRAQQRADADTTRANKAGQGRGSHGKDVLDKAKRDYNVGLNKARGKLQDSRSLATSIPGWDKKPMLKNQVQQAYDDYNENAKALFDEYKGQTGEDAELPAPAPLPYPWEKGGQQGEGSTPPAKQSKPSPASPAQPPASGQGKKTVQTYKSPKSGKTYNVGDTIKGGAYDGKKIGAIYEDGTMELQ